MPNLVASGSVVVKHLRVPFEEREIEIEVHEKDFTEYDQTPEDVAARKATRACSEVEIVGIDLS